MHPLSKHQTHTLSFQNCYLMLSLSKRQIRAVYLLYPTSKITKPILCIFLDLWQAISMSSFYYALFQSYYPCSTFHHGRLNDQTLKVYHGILIVSSYFLTFLVITLIPQNKKFLFYICIINYFSISLPTRLYRWGIWNRKTLKTT